MAWPMAGWAIELSWWAMVTRKGHRKWRGPFRAEAKARGHRPATSIKPLIGWSQVGLLLSPNCPFNHTYTSIPMGAKNNNNANFRSCFHSHTQGHWDSLLTLFCQPIHFIGLEPYTNLMGACPWAIIALSFVLGLVFVSKPRYLLLFVGDVSRPKKSMPQICICGAEKESNPLNTPIVKACMCVCVLIYYYCEKTTTTLLLQHHCQRACVCECVWCYS